MAFGYGEDNRFADQVVASSITSGGTYGPAMIGDVNGALALVVEANGESGASVASGKLTMQIQGCDTESGTYSSNGDVTTITATSWSKGQEVWRCIVPNGVGDYVKLNVGFTTSSGAVSGSLDAHLQYMAR